MRYPRTGYKFYLFTEMLRADGTKKQIDWQELLPFATAEILIRISILALSNFPVFDLSSTCDGVACKGLGSYTVLAHHSGRF
jgi:hypothetical protein